eukprot:952412-Rhodomonas_salina.2
MVWWMTKRTSGLLMPIPNAIVATMTCTNPSCHCRCTELRYASFSPAWYGRQRTPSSPSCRATSSASRCDKQYTIPHWPLNPPRMMCSMCAMSALLESGFGSTLYTRFGRFGDPRKVTQRSSPSMRVTSSLTLSVAVAVNAMIGTLGNCRFRMPSFR